MPKRSHIRCLKKSLKRTFKEDLLSEGYSMAVVIRMEGPGQATVSMQGNGGAANPLAPDRIVTALNEALVLLSEDPGNVTNRSDAVGLALDLLAEHRVTLLSNPEVRCNFDALTEVLNDVLQTVFTASSKGLADEASLRSLLSALRVLVAVHNHGADGMVPAMSDDVSAAVKHIALYERLATTPGQEMALSMRRLLRSIVSQYWLYMAAAVEADTAGVVKHFRREAPKAAATFPELFRYYVVAVSRISQQLLFKPGMHLFENAFELVAEFIVECTCRTVPALHVEGTKPVAVVWLFGFTSHISHYSRLLTSELTSTVRVPAYSVKRGWGTSSSRIALSRMASVKKAMISILEKAVEERTLTPHHLHCMSVLEPFHQLVADALLLLSRPTEVQKEEDEKEGNTKHYMYNYAFAAPMTVEAERSRDLLGCVALFALQSEQVAALVTPVLPRDSVHRLLSLWLSYFAHRELCLDVRRAVSAGELQRTALLVIPHPPLVAMTTGLALMQMIKHSPNKCLRPALDLMLEAAEDAQDAFWMYMQIPSSHRRPMPIEGFYSVMGLYNSMLTIAAQPEASPIPFELSPAEGLVALSILSSVFPLFRSTVLKDFGSDKIRERASERTMNATMSIAQVCFERVSTNREALHTALTTALGLARRPTKPGFEDLGAHAVYPYICGMGTPVAAKNLALVDARCFPRSRATIRKEAQAEEEPATPPSSPSNDSMLERLWVPTALIAMQMKGLTPAKAHDALIAPIREQSDWTLDLIPTYLEACAPSPVESPAPKYGRPTDGIMRRYAAAVRSVCQVAETYHSPSAHTIKSVATSPNSSVSDGVAMALLVVDRTFLNLVHFTHTTPTGSSARMYGAALINLIQCSDPRVVHRVCDHIEEFLLQPQIRGNAKLNQFWVKYLSQTVQRSSTSSTKASLAQWLLELDDRLRWRATHRPARSKL